MTLLRHSQLPMVSIHTVMSSFHTVLIKSEADCVYYAAQMIIYCLSDTTMPAWCAAAGC